MPKTPSRARPAPRGSVPAPAPAVTEAPVPAAPLLREPGAGSAREPGAGTSFERGLRLLQAVASAGKSVSLAELASGLGLPKATAHRLCAQLLEAGFLGRDVEERSFVVGPALRRLALDTLNHDSVRGLRHQVLAQLVADIGETCNFTALDGANVLYLDRVEAPWPWRLTLDPGVRVPLHCTASGKLFLAMLPVQRREQLLSHLQLDRLTSWTLTDLAALRQECETIAAQGYSVDREEFIPGLIAVAVPVTDAQGQTRAGIAVHAPVARMDLATALGKLPQLREAAVRMGRLV